MVIKLMLKAGNLVLQIKKQEICLALAILTISDQL